MSRDISDIVSLLPYSVSYILVLYDTVDDGLFIHVVADAVSNGLVNTYDMQGHIDR